MSLSTDSEACYACLAGCLGITLSFHRQLSHRSFQTPKWLEYALAYCGVLAVQGDPIEWVSSHRYHHLHTDTPLDPHSPYEGFWWSHMGWLLNNGVSALSLLFLLAYLLCLTLKYVNQLTCPLMNIAHPKWPDSLSGCLQMQGI